MLEMGELAFNAGFDLVYKCISSHVRGYFYADSDSRWHI